MTSAVTASAAPVIITATDLPADIPAGAFQGGATTSFFNVPANAASLTIVADITDSRPTDMKVIVFPGTDPSDPFSLIWTTQGGSNWGGGSGNRVQS